MQRLSQTALPAPLAHGPRPFRRTAQFTLFLLTAALALLGLSPHHASATTYYVSTTGSASNSGLSWQSPKGDLQGTINGTVSGDQIWVKTGTYTGNFTAQDGVALYGGFAGTETSTSQRNIAAHPTALDGASNGSVVTIPSIAGTVTLDGFTIQHGSANNGAGVDFPSGSGTLDIVNSIIADNEAEDAGAVYDGSASSTLNIGNSLIANNTALTDVNALDIYSSNATILQSTIESNTGTRYAAVFLENGSKLTTEGCLYSQNTAQSNSSVIYVNGSATLSARYCSFTQNGTGIDFEPGMGTISDCEFTANTSDAVHIGGNSSSQSPITIKSCLFAGMGSSGGTGVTIINNSSTITVSNNTIVNCSESIYLRNEIVVDLANNIFYGNTYSEYNGGVSGSVSESHNCYYDNTYNSSFFNNSDISSDPLFVDAANGDYRLTSSSPCINAGDDSYVSLGDTDLNGNPRISGSYVDIGCYEYSPGPTVASFTPTSGPVGTSVTITGTNFAGGATVKFNGVTATTVAVNSSTQITAQIPSGATTGPISVTTSEGVGTSNTNFTVTASQSVPTVTSFTPTSGPVGTVVTVTGTHLNGVTAVRFHNANATTFSANAQGTQLTVTAPTGAGTGTFTITTPGGSVKTTGTFTVTVPPTVSMFTPMSGPIGTVVTVTGTNLNGVTAVRFHNANATTFSANAQGTTLTVTVPTGAGTGTFTITTPGGSVKTAGTFTVTTPPTITSLSPTSGPVGTTVTITGMNLAGTTNVKFNGTPATTFRSTSTTVTATVPAGATTGPIAITTPNGTATTSGNFTVTTSSTGSISGTVFKDVNGNGTQDGGDTGLADVTVFIDTNGNGTFDSGEPSATTDANGNYTISNLPPGTYRVEIVDPSGYHRSYPSLYYYGYSATVTANQTATGFVFGETQTVIVFGYVYNDANASGQYDSGESLLSGWTVFLNENGSGQPGGTNPTATTDANGYYQFPGLAVGGNYSIYIVLQPGYRGTQPSGGYYTTGTTTSGYAGFALFGVTTVAGSEAAAHLTSLAPSSKTAGSAAFTLTVTGTGFVSGATVEWNGAPLTTTFVSSTQVTASVPASDVAAAGTESVTVVNAGALDSNALTFTVH